MNNYIRIFLIIIFFSSCSFLDVKKYHLDFQKEIYFNKNILNKNYIGMTRDQIIYMFGTPIISDSFSDIYHYCIYNKKEHGMFEKEILNLYFRDNVVVNFNIQ